MKHAFKTLTVICLSILLIQGCKKEDLPEQKSTQHTYGVLAPSPADYMNVNRYNPVNFQKTTEESSVHSNVSYDSMATPAVRNQGPINSCTAFVGSEVVEILLYYRNGGIWPTLLSPAYLYYIERVKIRLQLISADAGATMLNIPQALQGYGVSADSLYTYPANDKTIAYLTPPSNDAVSSALNYRIGQLSTSYGLLNSGDTASVKSLLRSHIPVMMGFNVYDNTSTYQYFEGLNKTNYTYNPLSSTGALLPGLRLLGGHGVLIIGYDDNRQVFIAESSWGASWGNKGFFLMPYSVFMSRTIVAQGNVYYAVL